MRSAQSAFRRPERRLWVEREEGAKWLAVPVSDGTGHHSSELNWCWGWGGDGGAQRPGNDAPRPPAAASCKLKGELRAHDGPGVSSLGLLCVRACMCLLLLPRS